MSSLSANVCLSPCRCGGVGRRCLPMFTLASAGLAPASESPCALDIGKCRLHIVSLKFYEGGVWWCDAYLWREAEVEVDVTVLALPCASRSDRSTIIAAPVEATMVPVVPRKKPPGVAPWVAAFDSCMNTCWT